MTGGDTLVAWTGGAGFGGFGVSCVGRVVYSGGGGTPSTEGQVGVFVSMQGGADGFGSSLGVA